MSVRSRVTRLAAPVWHRLGGRAQWALIWVTQPHFLVAVCGVVQDPEGRVLLLRARFWPRGSWGLPAGYVKHGETVQAALAREVREETGYAVAEVEILRVLSGYRRRVEFVCRARLAGGRKEVDPGEVLALDWFPLAELPAGLLRTHVRHVEAAIGGADRRIRSDTIE
ncbi:MAG: NUDIX domain-containing protein [Candidatus Dormibacteraceae bacterium]